MVELHDIEMKEVDPSNGSNPTNTTTTSKDEKKDADTLTLDGLIRLFYFIYSNLIIFFLNRY
jgi:hypothetical protein